LNWKPSEELLFGETLDIIVFRLPWFSKIWYYDPVASFPTDKMLPGYFLNIAPEIGDTFSYVILPQKEFDKFNKHRRYSPQTLTRSVVRLHNQSHGHAPTYSYDTSKLVFKDMNGKELMEEDDALVDSVSFHDDISVDDIGYHHSEELVEDLNIDEDGTIFIPPQFSADHMIDNVYGLINHRP
jgi:hypothetical protein